ncbi:MAG: SRPBCC family protein, partial [Brachybacterium tyrofermentans]
MPVTDISHDLDALTLTITAQFAAPVQRIWDIYADPRQLEKVWGPPEYPATVVDHDLSPGGRVTYYMTGPEGDHVYGYWNVLTVEEPSSFSYEDGFADESFAPNP